MPDLTPPFEEPDSSPAECDEALDGAAGLDDAPCDIDLFDLNNWIEEGDVLLGFTGMLKVMHEDGTMVAFQVGLGINEFEALGLYQKASSEIQESIGMETYWNED